MTVRKKILLIQDGFSSTQIEHLHKYNFDITKAGSSEEASNLMDWGLLPAVVVAATEIVEANRFRFLDDLSKRGGTTNFPIVLFSNGFKEEACLQGLKAGANDFILEPFTVHELAIKLNTQIELTELKKSVRNSGREKNLELTDIFEQAPVAIALLKGRHQIYTFANPLYQRIFNRAKDELIGRSIREVFPEIEGQGIYEIFERVYSEGIPYISKEHEAVFDRKGNGVPEKGYFNFVAQPIRDGLGNVDRIIIVAYETTEQVLANKMLKMAEAEQRFLSDATKLLSETLDHKEMLKSLAQAAVSAICDYCFIDIISSGKALERVAWAQADPDEQPLFADIKQFKPSAEKIHHPVVQVLETQQPLSISDVTDDWLRSIATSKQHFNFMKGLHLKSVLFFPLVFRGMKLGVLVLSRKLGNGNYQQGDIRLAEELAKRISIAVYNSYLYEQLAKELAERKNAEKELRKSEQRFRKMADTVPVIIWLTDQEGSCIYLNKQWINFTGQRRHEAMGYGWLDAVHRQDRANAVDSLQSAGAHSRSFKINVRLKNRKGVYRWFLVMGRPRLGPNKRFDGFIGVSIDIHESKIAEENLQDREKKLSISIEAGNIGIWEKDFTNRTTTFSRELQLMLGREGETGDGAGTRTIYKVDTHKDDIPFIKRYFKSIFKNREEEFALEFRILKPDSRIIWIAEKGRVLYGDKGPLKMYGTCIDITHRKFLEQQKDDFLSIASHELKTPVTSIKGNVQLLEERFREDGFTTAANQLAKVDAQIDKLVKLIADLLDVTKIEAGKLEFSIEQFDFDTLVDEVIQAMQLISGGHKLERIGRTGALVRADRNKIEQVIVNLISNATKYSPGSEKVIVGVSVSGESVKLSITDFGIGIPQQHLQKIFNRFYSVKSRSYNTAGLGLGLYISAEIIKAQNGTIWAESNPGEGSVFSFTLPLTSVEQ